MCEGIDTELARIDKLDEYLFTPQEKEQMKKQLIRRQNRIVKLKEEEQEEKTIIQEVDEMRAKIRELKRKARRDASKRHVWTGDREG